MTAITRRECRPQDDRIGPAETCACSSGVPFRLVALPTPTPDADPSADPGRQRGTRARPEAQRATTAFPWGTGDVPTGHWTSGKYLDDSRTDEPPTAHLGAGEAIGRDGSQARVKRARHQRCNWQGLRRAVPVPWPSGHRRGPQARANAIAIGAAEGQALCASCQPTPDPAPHINLPISSNPFERNPNMARTADKVPDGITENEATTGQIESASASTGSMRTKRAVRSQSARSFLAASALLLFTAGTTAALASPAVAAPKPTILQSLGKPTVAAKCKGGSYRPATTAAPMTTVTGKKWTSGFSLIGTNCNTFFTWRLNGSYSSLKAVIALDAANSGPLSVQFASGNVPVKFQAGGKTVSQIKISSGSSVQVNVRGLRQVSIVLPNPGSDAGILDVTSNTLS